MTLERTSPRLAASLAAGLLAATVSAPAAVAQPVDLTSPIVSGLPWRSGGKCADCPGFAGWRGRPVDVVMLYVDHPSWDAMAGFIAKPYYRKRVKDAPQPVVSLPMLPKNAARQHAACARGDFDAYYRQFGSRRPAPGRPSCGSAGRRTSARTRTPGASTRPSRSRTTSAASGARRRR